LNGIHHLKQTVAESGDKITDSLQYRFPNKQELGGSARISQDEKVSGWFHSWNLLLVVINQLLIGDADFAEEIVFFPLWELTPSGTYIQEINARMLHKRNPFFTTF
jgi:hypothetical protein